MISRRMEARTAPPGTAGPAGGGEMGRSGVRGRASREGRASPRYRVGVRPTDDKLANQPRLSDSRLTGHLDDFEPARLRLLPGLREPRQRVLASDEGNG